MALALELAYNRLSAVAKSTTCNLELEKLMSMAKRFSSFITGVQRHLQPERTEKSEIHT